MMPWTDRAGNFSPFKTAVLAVLLIPALLISYYFAAGLLGPRPITEAIHETGDWAIRFLWLSLAITPLRRIGQWPKFIIVRRMIGVAAFFYAMTHFLLYITDQKWDLWRVSSEIVLRFYLTIGFISLLGLAALAATSTDAAVKRLGKKWNQLHKIVYAIAILTGLHFFLQTKADVFEATIMAGLFILLMSYRIAHWRGFSLSSLWVLAGLAVFAGLATAGIEYAWYALATGVPPERVLAANLQFSYTIRPAWWTLAIGLSVAIAAFVRSFFVKADAPRGRRAASTLKA
jgi:sulfoxide reductase heme-binding subunit YedZ